MIRQIITLFCLAAISTVSAQTFTEHLTASASGDGKVKVYQDPRLDAIVNGTKRFVVPNKEKKDNIPGVQTGQKIKARGYRIQVYWGGSTRNDQANAQRAGNKVTAVFPELQAYTKFQSPNWSCYVGDFSTREEANDYLQKLKKENVAQNADVVKSEVYVYK